VSGEVDDFIRRKIFGESPYEQSSVISGSERSKLGIPESQILDALKMVGALEARGYGGEVGIKMMKKITIKLARGKMWPYKQILEAIQEGRIIESLTGTGQ